LKKNSTGCILKIISTGFPPKLGMGGLLVGVCTGPSSYKTILNCLKNFSQFLQTARFVLLSIIPIDSQIQRTLPSQLSATASLTPQCNLYFQFFGGSYIQDGVMMAILIVNVAILLCKFAVQCTRSKHLNWEACQFYK
jgi:hypothetical protein